MAGEDQGFFMKFFLVGLDNSSDDYHNYIKKCRYKN